VSFSQFIARRILLTGPGAEKQRLSRPIVTIAVLGIIIGMAVMILTVGVTSGFQRSVRAKVIGAGGHLQIVDLAQTNARETPRMLKDQPFRQALDTLPGVAHIQPYAMLPGIVETGREIQGVVVKGVDTAMDWRFLQENLVQGRVPNVHAEDPRSEVLLSRWLSRRLNIGLGDTITIYLVKGREEIRPRKYTLCGIYHTGLEQLDHELVYTDLRALQRFAQWGIKAEMEVRDTCAGQGVQVKALGFGGDRNYRYQWSVRTWHGQGPHTLCAAVDTTVWVAVSDGMGTVPDTAWARLRPNANVGTCPCHSELAVQQRTSGGSYGRYVGGFEVSLHRYEDLLAMDDLIYGNYLGVGLRTTTVRERFPEIFAWLELLDTNVVVVIVLMVIVAIVNMTSALLILILERTRMIGVLKALGATNSAVRGIFLLDAAYILGAGILLGDVLGVLLALAQQQWGIVTLPLESYYVSAVPVDLQWRSLLVLNVGTLVVCVAAMLLPSMLVSRIAPVRAIRFD
jgi:lipoprotein-releasing system permease protein